MAKKKTEAGFVAVECFELRHNNGEDPYENDFDDHSLRRYFHTREEANEWLKMQADVVLDEKDIDTVRNFKNPKDKVISVYIEEALYFIHGSEKQFDDHPFSVYEFDEEDQYYYGKALIECPGHPFYYIAETVLFIKQDVLDTIKK